MIILSPVPPDICSLSPSLRDIVERIYVSWFMQTIPVAWYVAMYMFPLTIFRIAKGICVSKLVCFCFSPRMLFCTVPRTGLGILYRESCAPLGVPVFARWVLDLFCASSEKILPLKRAHKTASAVALLQHHCGYSYLTLLFVHSLSFTILGSCFPSFVPFP